jgi:hypothetical protein
MTAQPRDDRHENVRTDHLIELLAATQRPRPRVASWAPVSLSLAAGMASSILLMALTLGVRPDLGASLGDPAVWLKLCFSVLVLLAGGIAAWRLSLPGKGWSGARLVLFLGSGALAICAFAELARLPVTEWVPCIAGQDWLTCLVAIPLLSLPTLLAGAAAMRRLAPTRLGDAGMLLGLASGGAAALAFTLYCQDDAVPFVAVWYGLALGLSALLGRVLGPRLLRW